MLRLISLAIILVFTFGAPNSSLANDNSGGDSGSNPDFEVACRAVASFLGGAGGYSLGAMTANGAIAAGLGAAGVGLADDILTDPCDAALNEYIDYWEQVQFPYPDYIDDYCDGEYWRCPDPLLNPTCYPIWTCDNSTFPPSNPWDCGTIGNCMPWMVGIGLTGVSIQDVIDGIFYLENSLAADSWDPTQDYNPDFDFYTPPPDGL